MTSVDAATSRTSGGDPSRGPREVIVHCPGDGRVVGHVPDQTAADVARTVRVLRSNQGDWEALGVKERVRWLGRFRDWLLDNDKRIARILQEETGKPWAEATLEVPVSVQLINYYCDHAAEFLDAEHPSPHHLLLATKRLTTVWRPYPVVGVITPWNFPLTLSLWDAVPALLAGAAVVVKPSEFTPLAVREVVRGWIEEVGAPGVFACATGLGATGAAVVDQVDYVQFTGSTRTGKIIAQRAAERLIPFSLELGGKDAAIVLADADPEHAASGIAFGGLCNAGQMCTSVERIYVEAPVYDEFVDRLTDEVRSLRQGLDNQDYRVDVGALANEAQLKIVERHVEDAVAKGARVLTGGKPTGTGTFFAPTVLVDVDHSMACMREETFGPTLPVMKVADAEEAIRLANDSSYGLSATVWTRNRRRGEDIARRLEAGAVNVNDVAANLLCFPVPMAGWKTSGVGARNGGAYGILKYCRPQAITAPRVPLNLLSQLAWYPYGVFKGELTSRVMRLTGARDLRRRLGL
jgi:acyl-CoA reductase-like NAD-dependent aldehyde dehydrogenase